MFSASRREVFRCSRRSDLRRAGYGRGFQQVADSCGNFLHRDGELAIRAPRNGGCLAGTTRGGLGVTGSRFGGSVSKRYGAATVQSSSVISVPRPRGDYMGGKDGAEKIAAAPQVHVIPQNQTRSYWNGEMRVAEAVAVHPSSSETLQTRAFRAQRLTFQVAAGAQLLTNGVFGNWLFGATFPGVGARRRSAGGARFGADYNLE